MIAILIILCVFLSFFPLFKTAQWVYGNVQYMRRDALRTAREAEELNKLRIENATSEFRISCEESLVLRDNLAGKYAFFSGIASNMLPTTETRLPAIFPQISHNLTQSSQNVGNLENIGFTQNPQNLIEIPKTTYLHNHIVTHGINRLAICGGTGSGKTTVARQIACEYASNGTQIVVFDPKPRKSIDRKWPGVCAGSGYDYNEISALWSAVFGEMERRRNNFDNIEKEHDVLIVCDEINLCVENVSGFAKQYQRVLCEGREYRFGIIVLGQTLDAASLGLKGRYNSLIRSFQARITIEHNVTSGERLANCVFEGENEPRCLPIADVKNVGNVDTHEQRIRSALLDGPKTKTELFTACSRNLTKNSLNSHIKKLIENGEAEITKEVRKKGRPANVISLKNQKLRINS